MQNFEEYPEESVQYYSVPNRATLACDVSRLFEEEEFVMFSNAEAAELIEEFAGKEIDPRELASKMINMLEHSERSLAVTRTISRWRRSSLRQFDDNDYIFAKKHRYRVGANEARKLLDTMVIDPAAASWGHEVIDDAEWAEIYGPSSG